MRRALGRGLEALLPAVPSQSAPPPVAHLARTTAPAPTAPGAVVRAAEIAENPDQPRRRFDPEALAALAESIRCHGVLQPLVVRRTAAGYELIAGERRLRAARLAGLEEVPVVLRDAEPPQRLELALIENLQRADLSPLEEAEAYRQLIEVYGLTQDDIARTVGKSRPAVANALRLLALPDAVKAQLDGGELSAGHARAVLSVEGDEARTAFAREIAAKKLPKSEAERLARGRRPEPPAQPRARDPHWRALADELTRGLGTRVRIHPRDRGGTIEIEFYSEAELERLLAHLRSRDGGDRAF
jgi:ParB family chromosome partitioning protein